MDYSKQIYDDIKSIVKEVMAAQNPAETVGGEVVSLNPTVITLDTQNDPLPSALITVPAAYGVREYKDVTLEVTEGTAEVIGGEGGTVDLAGKTIKGKLTFDNSLKEGDKVYMVRGQDGQRFVVTGKAEEKKEEESGGE